MEDKRSSSEFHESLVSAKSVAFASGKNKRSSQRTITDTRWKNLVCLKAFVVTSAAVVFPSGVAGIREMRLDLL
jgi:hypothetical protein